MRGVSNPLTGALNHVNAIRQIAALYGIGRELALRLVSSVLSHSSGSSSSMGVHTPLMPALANTTSSRPKARAVS